MSDVSQGPGWWLASDGKWYPPESAAPTAPPPPPAPAAGMNTAPPAYMPPPQAAPKTHTGLIIMLSLCGGLFVLFLIVVAIAVVGIDSGTDTAAKSANSSGESSSGDGASTGNNQTSGVACKDASADAELDTQGAGLYVGRPDAQDEDHEAAVGDCVRFQGYTAYVTSATTESAFGDLGGDPITVVTVRVDNRDDGAQPYNLFDWSLQTPSGQVLNPTIYIEGGDLGSGDLVPGGTVTGKIAFDAPAGQYYVIYKPDPFDSARGIWQITA